jgi:hypothetical protein
MKIKLNAFLIALASMLLANGAIAQNKPYACQEDAAAGLSWDNGRWVTSSFNEKKFVLVQQGDNLTTESVAKIFNNPYLSNISCTIIKPEILCFDISARVIYFNPDTLKGTLSRNFGATMTGNQKDSLTVSAFSCAPF